MWVLRAEHVPEVAKPFHRVVAAVGLSVAIGPVVVARNQHERMAKTVEQPLALHISLVVAPVAPALDVANMDHEGQLLGVDLLDDLFQADLFERKVRCVAQRGEAEGEPLLGLRLSRYRGGSQLKQDKAGT